MDLSQFSLTNSTISTKALGNHVEVSNEKVKEKKILIVETIRGLAALAVCLFHFTKTNLPFHGSSKYFKIIFGYGWLGVESFFVLSGFIIVYSLIKSGYTINKFPKFFSKRCLRIEPPYIVSIAVVVFLGYISSKIPGFKGADFELNILQIVTHVAYLPEYFGLNWLQPVYWSLEAEFHYYLIIGLFLPIIWKNKLNLVFSILIGLVLSYFIPMYVFSYMPLFIMGISASAYKLGRIDLKLFLAIIITCVLVSVHRNQPLLMPAVGIITTAAIIWLKFSNSITNFLGKISFSLYLIHVPIGGRILNFAGRYSDTEYKTWLALFIALIVTIFVSWIFYILVELPAIKLSKKVIY